MQLTRRSPVKHRIKAAIAAVTFIIVPGALAASPVNGTITAYEFDDSQDVVTGVSPTWQVQRLRDRGFTEHRFIDDPNIMPPGACRSVAIRWNAGILMGRSRTYFTRLLAKSAQHNCSITFVREDAANPDGSFDLQQVAPK
jgi:hypothetical protein